MTAMQKLVTNLFLVVGMFVALAGALIANDLVVNYVKGQSEQLAYDHIIAMTGEIDDLTKENAALKARLADAGVE